MDDIRMELQEIGLGSYGSRYGLLAGSCERGDETSGSTKCGEVLD